ncbi:MAG TPA: YafY family protein [Acidimicrobiales bacterium]|nr:YafY family protein [Acidimicrobiales bacterium]
MGDTPGRMLELLGLLQARASWSGAELAERLEVTERTVRRDMDRLRLLGYPVEAVPGRYGGYQLGRGGSLPPLLLNDDEAVAVAIGLRTAVDGSIAGLEESAVSVLAKLDQLLPARLAVRVRAVHDNTASLLGPARAQKVEASHLLLLAHACSARERVRFEYTDKGGKGSRRLVEPLQVVRSGARWYLAARDIDRADWRTFRLDRIRTPENVGTRFELTDPPDAVELVTAGFASMPYPFTARIRLPVTLEEAARLIPRTVAMFEISEGSTIVELGSSSLERMVAYLAGMRPPCEVIEPPELRRALVAHIAEVAAANA